MFSGYDDSDSGSDGSPEKVLPKKILPPMQVADQDQSEDEDVEDYAIGPSKPGLKSQSSLKVGPSLGSLGGQASSARAQASSSSTGIQVIDHFSGDMKVVRRDSEPKKVNADGTVVTEDKDVVMNDDLLDGTKDDDSDSGDSELDRVELPPEPEDEEVDPDLDERIAKFLDMKENGKHLNETIIKNRDYSNPYILEKIIQLFQVDEYSSNFPKDRFNPDMYKNLI